MAHAVTVSHVGSDALTLRRDAVGASHARLKAQMDAVLMRSLGKGHSHDVVQATHERGPDGRVVETRHAFQAQVLGADYLRSWAVVAELARALADDVRHQLGLAEEQLRCATNDAAREKTRRAVIRAQALADEVAVFQGLDALQNPAARPPETITRAMDDWLHAAAPGWSQLVGRSLHRAFKAMAQRAVTDPALRGALKQVWPQARGSLHMMLGAAQRVTNQTRAGEVRLLCLDSGPDIDAMFCDAGVIEFWIGAQDLAAGRFDRAVACSAGC
ncbi:MAG: DUF1963 domain-containing protein [Gemmobacter sp.]